jgi:hypothetical protein
MEETTYAYLHNQKLFVIYAVCILLLEVKAGWISSSNGEDRNSTQNFNWEITGKVTTQEIKNL